jgi:hypothetical protein
VNQFTIAKMVDEQCLVFGFANVSVSKRTTKGDGGEEFFDLQKDAMPPEELERAAYEFVLKFREADEMHEGDAIGQLIESIVFTPEKLRAFATDPVTKVVDERDLAVLTKVFPPRWWVAFKLNKASFAKVKSGEFTMFSIAGDAERVPA